MKRILLLSVFFILSVSGYCFASSVIYGTYSGSDNGKWIGLVSEYGSLTAIALSTDSNTGTSGSGYIPSSGQFDVYFAGGITFRGQITGTNVTGTWTGSSIGSGTIAGSVVDSSYALAYSGQYAGSILYRNATIGSWQATVGNDGLISGTSTINTGTSTCIGGVFPDGSAIMVALGESVISGQISGENVSGTWGGSSMSGTVTGTKTGALPTCRVIPSALNIWSGGSSIIPKVGTPVTFSASAISDCLTSSPYYYFSYCPNYGTSSYDSANGWVKMVSGSGFTTQSSYDHTFTQPGYYVVVVWTSATPSIPDPVTLIGATIAVDP